MKGRISIGNFIQQVKQELVEAQAKDTTPFYELKEVQLEVSFALDATAKASGKLFVVSIGGETSASQVHKVTLKLTPLKKSILEWGVDNERNDVGPVFHKDTY